MRKTFNLNTIFLFLFVTLLPNIIYSQWTLKYSSSRSLNSIYFTNSNSGWAVGYSGVIINTTDGGDSWNDQSSGVTENLWSVFFVNDSVGWVSADVGKILKTTNGGQKWLLNWVGINNHLFSTYFVNTNLGYAVCNGAICKTTDGGNNWSLYGTGTGGLHSVYFYNSLVGWVVGDGGAILKTTDGGSNWTLKNIGNNGFYSVFFINGTTGWIAGTDGSKEVIYKTIDGGDNWELKHFNSGNLRLNSIHFEDINNGWAVGNNNLIWNTNDGGTIWTQQTSATGYDILNSVYFIDKYTGFICSINGVIQKYSEIPPIPVELTSFNIEAKGNSVYLYWNTVTELNNYGFEIESTHSAVDNINPLWEKIGFVKGNGTTSSPKAYSFIDNTIDQSEEYKYRLKQIDFNGGFKYSKEVILNIEIIPTNYFLSQNYPNPFNPITLIEYAVPKQSNVKLFVYDIMGKEVQTLVNENKSPGYYQVQFNGSNLSSGIYFYRLYAGTYTNIKKLILVK